MPIVAGTYSFDGGPEQRCQVVLCPTSKPAKPSLADRYSRLELDLVSPEVRTAFDRLEKKMKNKIPEPIVSFGVDLSQSEDASLTFVIQAKDGRWSFDKVSK